MDDKYKIINTPLEGESSGDPFTEKRYVQFFSHFKDYNKILDVGCGNGRGGIILKELNPLLKLDGVEIVDEYLNTMPKNIYEKLRFAPFILDHPVVTTSLLTFALFNDLF